MISCTFNHQQLVAVNFKPVIVNLKTIRYKSEFEKCTYRMLISLAALLLFFP